MHRGTVVEYTTLPIVRVDGAQSVVFVARSIEIHYVAWVGYVRTKSVTAQVCDYPLSLVIDPLFVVLYRSIVFCLVTYSVNKIPKTPNENTLVHLLVAVARGPVFSLTNDFRKYTINGKVFNGGISNRDGYLEEIIRIVMVVLPPTRHVC